LVLGALIRTVVVNNPTGSTARRSMLGEDTRRRPSTGTRCECTQVALDALVAAQTAATRRPPFRVTPAHILVGLLRERRSGAGELLLACSMSEDRVWAAFDYRDHGNRGVRRLRDPLLGSHPRWTRAAREVVAAARAQSRARTAGIVDTIDLLAGVIVGGDTFAMHVLTAVHADRLDRSPAAREAHHVELERSPATEMPNFSALRKLHVSRR
jgi:ATP-dependent Clp protease ATP-binding subunit ClpA